MKIDFRCYKYLSNNLPHGSEHDAWMTDCKEGAKLFKKMVKDKFGDMPYVK